MRPQLIVALDVPTEEQAWRVMDRVGGVVSFCKVGLELFTAAGPEMVRKLAARGHEVFVDLKLHDIPNTVAGAVRSATRLGASLLTVHTLGGADMMRAAAEAARDEAERAGTRAPRVIGVTVLTSQRTQIVAGSSDVGSAVRTLAGLARAAGLTGVVASVEECAAIKGAHGAEFLVVTPGIRPSGASTHDQKRVATPAAAVEAGSDFLVVGRPILEAPDPGEAARRILSEMETARGRRGS